MASTPPGAPGRSPRTRAGSPSTPRGQGSRSRPPSSGWIPRSPSARPAADQPARSVPAPGADGQPWGTMNPPTRPEPSFEDPVEGRPEEPERKDPGYRQPEPDPLPGYRPPPPPLRPPPPPHAPPTH